MRVGCLAVMTAVTVAAVTLLSSSIYTVKIFDGERIYTVRTLNSNVTTVLSNLKLKSNSYKIENSDISGRTASIEIAYSYPVYITRGSEIHKIDFTGGTVSDAIAQAGFTLDEYDFVYPDPDSEITDTVYVDFTDITYVNGVTTEAIPYSTETEYSKSMSKGVTSLTQGVDGLKEIKYTEKLVNGVSVEKNVLSAEVLLEPVNEKKVIGTKVFKTSKDVKSVSALEPSKAIELDEEGNPVSYKSKMTLRATAYTYTGRKCATGVSPKPGYIAVNPEVIPYGTKLYIKSPNGKIIYGYAVAADTGGFVKRYPKGIDLFMASKSECISFGVKDMEVYILE